MGNCHRNSAIGRGLLGKYSILNKLLALPSLCIFPPCEQGKLNDRIEVKLLDIAKLASQSSSGLYNITWIFLLISMLS